MLCPSLKDAAKIESFFIRCSLVSDFFLIKYVFKHCKFNKSLLDVIKTQLKNTCLICHFFLPLVYFSILCLYSNILFLTLHFIMLQRLL